ncbi:LacI family DNA-binding transcriptional regulator [Cellulomonas aerilata]
MAVSRVTLQTLADELGVSRATVSNAFGRPDQLSAALRERILAKAEELGFAGPDPVGRGLRRGRVGAVGVLLDQGLSYAFSDPATVMYLDGLAQELQASGFGLLMHAGTGAGDDVALVRSALVDAWVVASLPAGHPAVRAAQAHRRPMVVFDQPDLDGVPTVGLEDATGAALATRHLLDQGHRRFGVLTMALQADGRQGVADPARQRRATYAAMARRLAGVRAEVSACGLDWSDVVVIECATNTVDTGALATWELLDRAERPSAVVAFSDQLAIGALLTARELGIAVPHDLSVVGFDDTPPAAAADPPLTTVSQPLHERGRAAGVLVRELVQGLEVQAPAPFPVELVVRGSTARVAG